MDLNDDEYENPNEYVLSLGKRGYPNPLDKTDGDTDHDGDSLTLLEEFKLWELTIDNGGPATRSPLSYSAGMQYSVHTVQDDGAPQAQPARGRLQARLRPAVGALPAGGLPRLGGSRRLSDGRSVQARIGLR